MTSWDAFAETRRQRRAWIRAVATPVTRWLVDALALGDGETVLELAAGAGDVGFAIVQQAGPGTRLISSDISPETLDVARAAARDEGLENVEFRELDAQAIGLRSRSADAVVCRWGYMLMPDPARALRETARILRPGGRVAFSVWAGRDRNPWTTIDADICAELGYVPQRSPAEPGGMFSLSGAARLGGLVQDNGLRVRSIEPVDVTWTYAGPADYIAIEIEQPDARGDWFSGLPDETRADAVRRAAERLAPFMWESGYAVPGEALNVLALKPG